MAKPNGVRRAKICHLRRTPFDNIRCSSMFAQLSQSWRRRFPPRSVIYAYVRAAFSRHRLPPGKLVRLEAEEKLDRRCILHCAAEWGPVFKAVGWNEFCVCIVGLSLGRRLLREHGDHLKPITLDLRPLFPTGFLRQMQGEDHQKYRQTLNRAIRASDLAENTRGLEEITRRALAVYVTMEGEHRNAADAYIATLSTITTEMLIQLFFGARLGTSTYDALVAGYRKLGPYGLIWNLGENQKAAFSDLRDCLLAHFSGDPRQLPAESRQSILGRMVEEGMPDATMLGNLIYMVEMGRYDSYSLFRWLTKYATDHPEMLARIALEDRDAPAPGKSLTEAFVLETLRMDQSERLMRRAQRDLVFDGYLIPKSATVRVCLWESHKSPDAFSDPLRFDPIRFLTTPPTSEDFAPFGLDHHRCPFADMSIKMGIVFLRLLARNYTASSVGDGLPVRGAYHWEPAGRFGVRLRPRLEVSLS